MPGIDRHKLISLLASGRTDFRGVNFIPGVDLSGLNLTGLNFSRGQLSGADCSHSIMDNTNLRGAS